ncbi:anthranilate synthase component II [Aliarcobacter skirrowii]|uniref:Anthranilate phosphoribosyltransferase / anthranilate synthase component II, TrpG subunit n=1 Tax=Aliarcobacter skirrowii CCUG 10374 TaxID=1032239 RepID=A0AAD0SNK2_9BACT|nr:aminodeoxychorismate/anthranilate synthase component II [Aliarcobacter skirrowii]AXX85487.1 anthranilate phosphoribosyltransferase / anthranilate synthase component II, TrpG subunit [Aliarcobacter skirrowii CCUG 10374]KAB0621104.1 aminodeoxychorismate/anthranilate synthase component II [Aliarcobacter skirrowii CCUG 10374]MDX4062103.1 aminodeoxychorismate/anthranilate synthase component II [Aliarcobacter skirrowii]RXI26275.1 type 1 glutamine amidotransferase [Aliarcobacter skirrowii CCUG 1037
MILMIDNYDSFTYNIVQYCLELKADLKIVRNDELTLEQIIELNPSKIIISPGPATPNEAGVCLDVIKYFSGKKPIFGICLGHQAIAQAFGAKVVRAKNLMHGKTSKIKVLKGTKIFDGLPNEFTQTRYHSLIVEKQNLPEEIIVTSKSLDDDEIMSLEIKDKNVFGVQFHPESILSEYGHKMFENFLKV